MKRANNRAFFKTHQKQHSKRRSILPRKRICTSLVSIILSVSMVLTLIPANAFANTGTESAVSVDNEKETDKTEEKVYQKEYTYKECIIGYNTINQWDNYASVEITIENHGEETLEAWELSFGYNAIIDSIWNADSQQETDGRYTLVSKDYNGVIKSGDSVSFGFIARGEGEVPLAPETIELQGEFYNETASEETARTVLFGKRYQVM